MKTFKNASWMVICALTIVILAEFHALAMEHLDIYGYYFRALVFFLGAIMAVKGVLHGAEFFGDFEDFEFDEYEEHGAHMAKVYKKK